MGKRGDRERPRKDILTALCLAAIFEDSGRSRTHIHRASRRRAHRSEVEAIVKDIDDHVLESVDDSKQKTALKRVAQLKRTLGLDQAKAAGHGQPALHDEDKASSN